MALMCMHHELTALSSIVHTTRRSAQLNDSALSSAQQVLLIQKSCCADVLRITQLCWNLFILSEKPSDVI